MPLRRGNAKNRTESRRRSVVDGGYFGRVVSVGRNRKWQQKRRRKAASPREDATVISIRGFWKIPGRDCRSAGFPLLSFTHSFHRERPRGRGAAVARQQSKFRSGTSRLDNSNHSVWSIPGSWMFRPRYSVQVANAVAGGGVNGAINNNSLTCPAPAPFLVVFQSNRNMSRPRASTEYTYSTTNRPNYKCLYRCTCRIVRLCSEPREAPHSVGT